MAKHKYTKQRIKRNPRPGLWLRLWAYNLTPTQRRSIIRAITKRPKTAKMAKTGKKRFF